MKSRRRVNSNVMWLSLFDNKRLLLLVWLGSTAAFAIGGVVIFNVPEFYRLATRGIYASAHVIRLEPNNHKAVYYSYEVDQQSYAGAGTASRIGRQSYMMTIGEIVPIVYDPVSPKSSCLGDPNKHLRSLAVLTVFLASAPTMYLFVLYVRKGIQSSAAT